MLEGARQKRNPLAGTKLEDITRAFSRLNTLDPEEWTKAFCDAPDPYEEKAEDAEAGGEWTLAKEYYLFAYATYRLPRYPAPNSPAKRSLHISDRVGGQGPGTRQHGAGAY